MISITSVYLICGYLVSKKFGRIDLTKMIYCEKFASGYSPKAYNKGKGGVNRVLHIIITDHELIVKTSLFMAYLASRLDLMKRIPLEKIKQTELKDSRFYSKLIVRYETTEGKLKDVVLISKNNARIKLILENSLTKDKV